MIILKQQKKKRREQGEKCHARTMMHSEADKAFKMKGHYVLLRQIAEIRLEKE